MRAMYLGNRTVLFIEKNAYTDHGNGFLIYCLYMQVLRVSWCDRSAYVMWPDVAAAHSTQPSLHWTDGEQPFTKYESLHLLYMHV